MRRIAAAALLLATVMPARSDERPSCEIARVEEIVERLAPRQAPDPDGEPRLLQPDAAHCLNAMRGMVLRFERGWGVHKAEWIGEIIEFRWTPPPPGVERALYVESMRRGTGYASREARIYDERLNLLWRHTIYRRIAGLPGAAAHETKSRLEFSSSGDRIFLTTIRETSTPGHALGGLEPQTLLMPSRSSYRWSESERLFLPCAD